MRGSVWVGREVTEATTTIKASPSHIALVKVSLVLRKPSLDKSVVLCNLINYISLRLACSLGQRVQTATTTATAVQQAGCLGKRVCRRSTYWAESFWSPCKQQHPDHQRQCRTEKSNKVMPDHPHQWHQSFTTSDKELASLSTGPVVGHLARLDHMLPDV